MNFDYAKLRARISERFDSETAFAKAIGLGRVSLSQKLNNNRDFSREQIIRACMALDIPMEEVDAYFFSPKG